MRNRKKRKREKRRIPITVIRAASHGDMEAMAKVLEHYERYIEALATRKLYDKNGRVHYCVDEELRRRLETKLVTKVLEFEIG